VPAWLSTTGLSTDTVWRARSALGAVWTFFRFVLSAVSACRSASTLPPLYLPSLPPNATRLLAFSMNALCVLPASTYSGHLLGIVAMLTCVGMMLVARFIAERGSDARSD